MTAGWRLGALLDRVGDIGIAYAPVERHKRLRLVNKGCLIAIGIAVPHVLIYSLAGHAEIAIPTALSLIFPTIVLLLHRRGIVSWPRVLLLLTVNATCVYFATVLPDRGSGIWLCFGLGVMPFFIFEPDQRRCILSFIALPLVWVIAVTVGGFDALPRLDLGPALVQVTRYSSLVTGYCAFVGLVFLLYRENHQNEMRLEASVDRRNRELEVRAGLEAELRDQRQQLFQFLEHMPAAVFVVDAAGVPRYANSAAAEYSGIVVGQDTGGSCGQASLVLRGSDVEYPPVNLPLTRALAGEEHSVEDVDLIYQGRRTPVFMKAAPIRDDEGQTVFVVVAFEEITERLRLERERLQGQKLESVGQLAAGIAHEINTPMQYIGDNTWFVERAVPNIIAMIDFYEKLFDGLDVSDDAREAVSERSKQLKVTSLASKLPAALKSSRDGVEAVSRIVRAMREFSHPGSNEKVPFDINAAIETTVTVSRNEWRYVAEMELHLEQDLPLVPCMPGELNQVVLNIIVNAAHAIGDVVRDDKDGKGCISILTSLNEPWATITIKDTGRGIPSEIIDQIYDPFFTTKEVGRGTGQGLAIARSIIVDKHQGRIDVTSAVGTGTTFTIDLPLAERESEYI